ncbi:MAG: GNAT family N-acetyltransferase [Thermodesulfobacteriota bacterium]
MALVVKAEEKDLGPWLILASEVEAIMGPLVSEACFQAALLRTLDLGLAGCVRAGGGPAGAALAGGVLLAVLPAAYNIEWLAVSPSCRRRGVGRALVEWAFTLAGGPGTMTVTTFAPDDPEGGPAREFYAALGFKPAGRSVHLDRQGRTFQVLHRSVP